MLQQSIDRNSDGHVPSSHHHHRHHAMIPPSPHAQSRVGAVSFRNRNSTASRLTSPCAFSPCRRSAFTSPPLMRTRTTPLRSFVSSSSPASKVPPTSTVAAVGNDRFIPNRARITDRGCDRRALLPWNDHDGQDLPSESRDDIEEQRHLEYSRHLHRVLFDEDVDSSTLLGLAGKNASTLSSQRFHPPRLHPLDCDILRSPMMMVTSSTRQRRRSKLNVTREFTLDMTGVESSRDDLHLMSVGPRIAVAIEDTVQFDEWGHHSGESESDSDIYIPPLELEHMGTISAIQWRYRPLDGRGYGNKYLLAVGGEDSVEVYDVERISGTTAGGNGSLWAQLTDHVDTVTALEWIHSSSGDEAGNDYELLASSSVGIRRYDLRCSFPEVFTYNSELPHSTIRDAPAAKMHLQPQNGNLLAAALPQKGIVALWDLRYSRLPMQTLEHGHVKGLEFCPHYGNTLASGGVDGIRLWNVQAGTRRSTIPTPRAVSSLTWSSPCRTGQACELLAGFGRYLGLWTFSGCFTESIRVGRWTQPNVGPVLAVERMNTDDGRVLSLHGSGSDHSEDGEGYMDSGEN